MKNKNIEKCFEGKSDEFRKPHKVKEMPVGITLCTLPTDYKKVCKEMGMKVTLSTYINSEQHNVTRPYYICRRATSCST